MARDYELTLIVDSQLAQDAAEETIKRYETFLTEGGAEDLTTDRRGVRKLAYEIGKSQQGNYNFLQFRAEGTLIQDLDRQARLDGAVIRHLIIHLEAGLPPAPEAVEEAKDESTEEESSEAPAEAESESEEDAAEKSETEEETA